MQPKPVSFQGLLGISITAVLLGLGASGCSWARPFTPLEDYALDLTEGVGKAHDQILFRNIVRSSHRLPQHWATVSIARGVESGSVSGGLNVPFGGMSMDDYTFETSGQYSHNPSFDVTPHVSAEFTRGIMQPVSLEQINHFLNQGWPQDFIFGLLVSEIRQLETDEGGSSRVVKVWHNRPDTESDFVQFKLFHTTLRKLLQTAEDERSRLRLVEVEGKTLWKSKEQPDLSQVASAVREGLLVEVGEEGIVVKRPSRLGLWVGSEDQLDSGAVVSQFVRGGERYEFTFRSTEALVYYLGQLMRARGKEGWEEPYFGSARDRKLFFTAREEGTEGESAWMDVEVEGKRYVIPKETPKDGDLTGRNEADPLKAATSDRSRMTFTFTTLLVGLNRNRSGEPSTGTVLTLPLSQ